MGVKGGSTGGGGGSVCVGGGGQVGGGCIHTEGGAHTRQFVATAGVLLFKGSAGAGPRVERSEPSRVRGGR